MKSDIQYYSLERKEILGLVDKSSSHILEFGCGYGFLGRGIKKVNPSLKLYGVEINPNAVSYLTGTYDEFKIVDIEQFNLDEINSSFDCFIYSDVLEHTRNPDELLKNHLKHLIDQGIVIISVPNIRNIRIIYKLLFKGDWTYSDAGILDNTHYKFFTRKTLVNMLEELNLKIEYINYNYESYSNVFNRIVSRIIRIFCKELIACQLIIKAKKVNAN